MNQRRLNGYERRNNRIKEMFGYDSYSEYLSSDLWKSIRARVLKRDGGLCVFCNRRANAVHHKFYSKRALKGTSLKKLVSICNECHTYLEFDDNGRKLTPRKARRRLRPLREKTKQFRKSQSNGEPPKVAVSRGKSS